MKRLPLLALTAALVPSATSCSPAPIPESGDALIVLVRHAEKRTDGGSDPRLTERGRRRADRLAAMLRPVSLVSVHASEYRRTQETARPVAAAAGTDVDVVPARDTDALVARLSRLDAGAAALVVGHSNTLPVIMRELGVRSPPSIAEDEYDDLFFVFLRPGAEPRLVHLEQALEAAAPERQDVRAPA